jgi:hypothetical protein
MGGKFEKFGDRMKFYPLSCGDFIPRYFIKITSIYIYIYIYIQIQILYIFLFRVMLRCTTFTSGRYNYNEYEFYKIHR